MATKPLLHACVALVLGASLLINCTDETTGPTVEAAAGSSQTGGTSGSGGSDRSVSMGGSSAGGDAGAAGKTSGTELPQQDAIGPIVGDRRVAFSPADDVQFIDFFVGHHKDAIEMAQMEIDMGASEVVRAMASKMVTMQTAEIEQMRAARLALTGQADSPPPPVDTHMKADMVAMMAMHGEEMDQAFLGHMIAHHAAGLAPAKRAKEHLKNADMLALAERMADDQSKEIGEMSALLKGTPHEEAAGADASLEGDRRVPLTPGSDVVFIDFFADHHAKAIEMALMVSDKGADPKVRELAQEIVATQQKELKQMRTARQELTGSANTPPSSDPHMAKDMQMMMSLSGEALDQMFLEKMIPHHGAGLPPAARALPFLTRADIKKLSEDIFRTQAKEIGEMKAMLAKERK